ncbi:MAG TPA: hypothetical protein VKC53_03815 [Patescibacteria group bacterium]|nr:hypothetical protein [Patescibacteria group bacterium]
MNETGSIVEFFYNIVPGSLFILFLKLFGIDISSLFAFNDPGVLIFQTIILSLFFGFLFQSIVKIWRDEVGNSIIESQVVLKNKDIFDRISRQINGKNYKDVDKGQTFKLMDAYLRGKIAAFLPTHFSSRFAFWSNLAVALWVIALLQFFMTSCFDGWTPLLVLVGIMSASLSKKYFYGYRDSTLKVYYMYVLKNRKI